MNVSEFRAVLFFLPEIALHPCWGQFIIYGDYQVGKKVTGP